MIAAQKKRRRDSQTLWSKVVCRGSAALRTDDALGLINLPEAWAGPPELPQGSEPANQSSSSAPASRDAAAYELNPRKLQLSDYRMTERAGGVITRRARNGDQRGNEKGKPMTGASP